MPEPVPEYTVGFTLCMYTVVIKQWKPLYSADPPNKSKLYLFKFVFITYMYVYMCVQVPKEAQR